MQHYNEYRLATYKLNNGRYVTYVFNSGVKAIAKYNQALRRHSVNMAKADCDTKDFTGYKIK
jgi:hypothetical protein